MNPYRKRKFSANSTTRSAMSDPRYHMQQPQFVDPFEAKLGLSPARQNDIDLQQSKNVIKRLQSRVNPTPDLATGVNYDYLRSNHIPVERVQYGSAKKKKRSKSPGSSMFMSSSPSRRAHSALSFYTSGNLSGEYAITVDDNESYMGANHVAHDSDSDDNDEVLRLTRSLLRDQDSIERVTKRISSASTTRRKRMNGSSFTDAMCVAAGAGATAHSTMDRSVSPSKLSSMNPLAQVLPTPTKYHLVEERRRLKTALTTLASSHASEPIESASLTIAPEQHIHQSFHRIISDIESDITHNRKDLHSKKHGFKRHFKNTTFDSHDHKKKRLNEKIYDAAREQEKRDRQEKEMITLMKAQRRRERQRKAFKIQQQKNFLKRVKSHDPRLLEQLADVLDPALDDDIEVSDMDFTPFASPIMRSRSTPATRPQSSSGSSRRVHKYPAAPNPQYIRSATPDAVSVASRSRPQSSSSYRVRSRPRSRLHSALERASSGFEYEESMSMDPSKDLQELDRLDRRLKQGIF